MRAYLICIYACIVSLACLGNDALPVKAETIETRKVGTSSCQAKFAVTIKAGDKVVNLDGDYVGMSDGRMRMRITYGSLATIVDIGVSNGKGHVLFPRKGMLFSGGPEEIVASCKEIGAIASEMGGLRALFPDPWETGASGRRISREPNREVIYVYRKNGDSINVVKKIILATTVIDGKSELVVVKSCKYNDEGQLIGMVSYSDYTKSKDGILYPSRTIVEFSDLSLTFVMSEVEINKAYKDSKFAYESKESEAVKTMPIADMSGIGLKRLLDER